MRVLEISGSGQVGKFFRDWIGTRKFVKFGYPKSSRVPEIESGPEIETRRNFVNFEYSDLKSDQAAVRDLNTLYTDVRKKLLNFNNYLFEYCPNKIFPECKYYYVLRNNDCFVSQLMRVVVPRITNI